MSSLVIPRRLALQKRLSLSRVFQKATIPPTPPGVFRLGLNVSGMEDNAGVPSTAELTHVKNQGIPVIRLPLTWPLIQASPGGSLVWGTVFDSQTNTTLAYNVAISTVLARAAAIGMKVMLDLHNFGNDMNGLKIGQPGASTPSQFADFWQKFVIFLMADPNYSALDSIDIMNEWSNMDLSGNPSTLATQALILNCNTLALAAVRGGGYLKRVYLEWDHFSGPWDAVANNVGQLMDLARSDIDAVVQLHGYLDDDASGTHGVWADEIAKPGLSPPGLPTNVNIGPQRLAAAVALAASKGVRLCLGETGWSSDALSIGGNDDYADWNQAGFNLLQYCQQNNIEAFVWGAGPGFPPSYIYNPEPTNVSNPGFKDFTSAGLQSTQMVILQQFSGYTGAQPLAYRADLPFGATPYTPSGTPLPNFKIRYNGVIPATITFTGHAKLADGTDAGGTFSSIAIPPGNNGIATFSYTPAISAAGISLTFTNDRGLIDPPPIGVSSVTDYFIDNNLAIENVFWMSRLVANFVGKAYTLGRDSDSQTLDVHFNNVNNLPRQAIQDFASSRSVKILKEYNQNPNFEDIDYGTGPYPLLVLDDGTGYPSILRNNVGVNFSSVGSVGAGQLTVFASLFPTNGGIFLTEDVFVESGFRLTPTGNFTVAKQNPGAIGPIAVSSGLSLSTWTLGQYTWSNAYGTNNLKSYLNGSANAAANTVTFNFNPLFGQITLGTFRFGGPSYTGGQRGFVIGYQEAGSGAVTDFWNRYHTYYTTALPDSLSVLNPLISGAAPRNMVTGKVAAPFSGVTISDGNISPSDSVTITLSGTGGGTLTGTGLSGSGPYTLAADTPANITTKLRALIYTPSGAAGTSEIFTLLVANASAGTSSTNTATVVTIKAVAAAETPFSAPIGTFTPINMKGVNISGGDISYPETSPSGFNYAYPFNEEIDYYASKGMGATRVPLFQLRLQPESYGSFDPVGRTDEYPSSTFGSVYPQTVQNNLLDIKRVLDHARSKNMYVILDLHDFGNVFDTALGGIRFPGADAEGTNILKDCLVRLVTIFKNYDNIIWDPMNEPVNMTAAQWITAANACLTAMAAVSPASKLMALCGGGNFSGAHDWVSSGVSTSWASLSVPGGWTVYAQPHQYLDSDNSGTHPTVVSGLGSTVLSAFTTWARANSVQAILGEFGWNYNDSQPSGGVPSTEGAALMAFMSANSDVWKGWTFFVGGNRLFYQNAGYVTASVPAGYPTGPFTDAPQMAIMTANL